MQTTRSFYRPRVGLVIGSYGAVPYVHLHLAMWHALYPEIPVLVHDDHSPQAHDLQGLCDDYGAAFLVAPERKGHQCGDLTAYARGLRWAHDLGLNILVKMSQRFIPVTNWVPALQQLAQRSPYATFTDQCIGHRHDFRTECAALVVPAWCQVVDEIEAAIDYNDFGIVEDLMHLLAQQVHRANRPAKQSHPVASPPVVATGYGIWPMLGHDGNRQNDNYLWHRAYPPSYYYGLAHRNGLCDYKPQDFIIPSASSYKSKRQTASKVNPALGRTTRQDAACSTPLISKLYESARAIPSDINEHLPLLAYLAGLCAHVTEFSAHSGDSALAFIHGWCQGMDCQRPQQVFSYDLNSDSQELGLKRAATEVGVQFSARHASPLAIQPVVTELLFIDSIHTYAQLIAELLLHGAQVSRFLVLHDTVTFGEQDEHGTGGEYGKSGLAAAVVDYLSAHPEWHLLAHASYNNGLTVLARRTEPSSLLTEFRHCDPHSKLDYVAAPQDPQAPYPPASPAEVTKLINDVLRHNPEHTVGQAFEASRDPCCSN